MYARFKIQLVSCETRQFYLIIIIIIIIMYFNASFSWGAFVYFYELLAA